MSKTTTPSSFFNYTIPPISNSPVPCTAWAGKNVNNRRELSLKRTRSLCAQSEVAWIGKRKKMNVQRPHVVHDGIVCSREYFTQNPCYENVQTHRNWAQKKKTARNNDDSGHREIQLQTHPGNDTKWRKKHIQMEDQWKMWSLWQAQHFVSGKNERNEIAKSVIKRTRSSRTGACAFDNANVNKVSSSS